MSVFSRKNTLRELREDLFRLQLRVDELESAIKLGKLESAELYDKTLRLMQRMAKRYEVDKRDDEHVTPPAVHPDTGKELDPVSEQILKRRGSRLRTA